MSEAMTLRPSGHEAPETPTPVPALPADAVIIVPVRNTVLFPGVVIPVAIGRTRSIAAAQQAVREQRPIGVVMQRNPEATDPLPIDLHRMGTIANVARYITAPDGGLHAVERRGDRDGLGIGSGTAGRDSCLRFFSHGEGGGEFMLRDRSSFQ